MKRILSLAVLILGIFSLQAQVKAPAPSPLCKTEQVVGLTNVSLEYSRPGVKDRTIFGGLVPYGEMWRTGANKNSMISFDTDVEIEGNEVKKGSYAIFTTPGEIEWEVVLYSDTENWGTPQEWNEEKVALKVNVEPQEMPMTIESMLIYIDDLRNTSATIKLMWENTLVPLQLEVPTDALVDASIEQTFAGPGSGDYYSAARYYREAGKDLDQALTWMNKAIEMGGEKFWVVRQKALIQAEMKDYKSAINTAMRSMELAKEAGNEDYVRNNKESIAAWKAMLQ